MWFEYDFVVVEQECKFKVIDDYYLSLEVFYVCNQVYVFCFIVVYFVVRFVDDLENLKIVEFKKFLLYRELIRCLINVVGWFMS